MFVGLLIVLLGLLGSAVGVSKRDHGGQHSNPVGDQWAPNVPSHNERIISMWMNAWLSDPNVVCQGTHLGGVPCSISGQSHPMLPDFNLFEACDVGSNFPYSPQHPPLLFCKTTTTVPAVRLLATASFRLSRAPRELDRTMPPKLSSTLVQAHSTTFPFGGFMVWVTPEVPTTTTSSDRLTGRRATSAMATQSTMAISLRQVEPPNSTLSTGLMMPTPRLGRPQSLLMAPSSP